MTPADFRKVRSDKTKAEQRLPTECCQVGRNVVDYIAQYAENVVGDCNFASTSLLALQHNRRVVPAIEPGYLRELLPTTAPTQPESYEHVMHDFEAYIMPGVSKRATIVGTSLSPPPPRSHTGNIRASTPIFRPPTRIPRL